MQFYSPLLWFIHACLPVQWMINFSFLSMYFVQKVLHTYLYHRNWSTQLLMLATILWVVNREGASGLKQSRQISPKMQHKAACVLRFISSSPLPALIYKSWGSPLKCPLKSHFVFITTHLPQATWRWRIRESLSWRKLTMSHHKTVPTPSAKAHHRFQAHDFYLI